MMKAIQRPGPARPLYKPEGDAQVFVKKRWCASCSVLRLPSDFSKVGRRCDHCVKKSAQRNKEIRNERA